MNATKVKPLKVKTEQGEDALICFIPTEESEESEYDEPSIRVQLVENDWLGGWGRYFVSTILEGEDDCGLAVISNPYERITFSAATMRKIRKWLLAT